MSKNLIYIFTFVLMSSLSYSQSENSRVSLIGESEKMYESLVSECSTMLLSVSDNRMDKAYYTWTTMLTDIEAHASNQNVDLKGVKMWINCFWNEDGTIRQIVYYPKPNSKNMDFSQVSAFLDDFASDYSLNMTHSSCFSHYGSASFPIFTKVKPKNEK